MTTTADTTQSCTRIAALRRRLATTAVLAGLPLPRLAAARRVGTS